MDELEFRAELLKIEIKMQGMVAENKIRERRGEAMAYAEHAFGYCIDDIDKLLLQYKPDALSQHKIGGQMSEVKPCYDGGACRNESSIEELREALRWRKYPEEKPDTDGDYLVRIDGICSNKNVEWDSWQDGEWVFLRNEDSTVSYWLPIPPLEEKDV